MKKSMIIIAVLEATVLLVMKLVDWKEAKTVKPTASRARQAAGRRVVHPATPEYDEVPPEGESSAINILAGGSAINKKIHKTK